MNTDPREHISSLMDGEVSRETGRFLVRRLGADDALCATWARYHLVRDCLRHQEGGLAGESLAAQVRRAIESESAPALSRSIGGAWLRPAVGMAIAASVALMAIVAVGPAGQPAQPLDSSLAEGVGAPAFTSPQSLTPAPVSQTASLQGAPAGESRMNAYLLRHYQAAGANGSKGFVTFVPIVLRPATVTANADPVDSESEKQGNSDELTQPR
jgi:sigma-E factor negative regulatory protein RseA